MYLIIFFSPVATSNAGNRNLMEIYATLFVDSMKEYSYIASNAGLSWNIQTTDYGFEVLYRKFSVSFDYCLISISPCNIDKGVASTSVGKVMLAMGLGLLSTTSQENKRIEIKK